MPPDEVYDWLERLKMRRRDVEQIAHAVTLDPRSAEAHCNLGMSLFKLKRLEENIGAASIQLTSDDLCDIERAASTIPVQGARYPEHLMQMTGR